MNALWRGDAPLILASQSPARKKLLRAAGIHFEATPALLDEDAVKRAHPDLRGRELAVLLAQAKAEAVSARTSGAYVLGSDQILEYAGAILSKPGSLAAAAVQLKHIAGATHTLWSAASLVRDGQTIFVCAASASLTLRPLSDQMIAIYLRAADPSILDCVGGYQLEAEGLHLFDRVEGDYWTILGLPLLEICRQMRERDLLAS